MHINQCNTDKQNLVKKVNMLIKHARYEWFSDYNYLNTRISEVDNKIPDTSSLVTATVLNTKIGEVKNRFPDHAKNITTSEFNKLIAEDFAAILKQVDLVSKLIFITN